MENVSLMILKDVNAKKDSQENIVIPANLVILDFPIVLVSILKNNKINTKEQNGVIMCI